ncbi:hypothetical protein SERLA73DRAFT_169465 [Serpula lacrymans var. lacrymans S7.3]|uniref:Cytochrome P450 n=2 Tax=Serpula lacrymans var. lacrymans TaxID=341189 RepID=F8Q042_SERL3|nr:uncharacterized protein SERLADRAFT_416298 [Serpula lacrymans var. lacrymans S7.9]EGN98514.1 hypothetical protein SERLA73DRAFT_169465 [Serpula lacrymans var. lacrymans S7.3]EGO24086.1 hypothetical protein SERLADRAFT_416298 [Serpula lacrymans var. lacrymans S7.9]
MTLSVNWLDVSLAGLALYFVNQLLKKKPAFPLPPGPKGLPLLGNALDMPKESPWLTLAKWGEKYGDISSVKIFGQHMIIVNSASAAFDMMDNKGLVYSDRPQLTVAGDIVGWNQCMVLLQYGDDFREQRKHLYRTIGSRSSMQKYENLMEGNSQRFLRNVLRDPSRVGHHVRTTAGSNILRISHGYEAQNVDDPFLKVADKAMHYYSVTTAAGAFFVDIMPILRYLPDWFPGTQFKTIGKNGHESLAEMTTKTHEYVKEQMKAGTALHSFTSELLEDREVSAKEEHLIKWSALTLYAGGSDTTVAAIHSFFLAMTLFPDVQKKAQAEIDSVIGTNRLPTIADRQDLPYINAMVLEVLRWHVLGPLGVAHASSEDDVYNGFFIPKGSIIVPNIWKMLHDPEVYKNPEEFNPDRFIASEGKPAETDPRGTCFGFGRRICPGIVLAELSIFISCAMVSAVFEISKCVENGVSITPEIGQTSGTISHPKPFKCAITVRSEKALSLIEEV